MPKLVQFGAGNVGRSFIGQLFSTNGYEVVFVDVDEDLVNALNTSRKYRVVVKHPSSGEEICWVSNVRAVNGRDVRAVAEELATADYAATSVGQRALGSVVPLIAEGIVRRALAGQNDTPFDLIIAENIRNGAEFIGDKLRASIEKVLETNSENVDIAPWFPGLVETSIGKMVPIMTEADRREDPLQVFAEPYNTLIVDALGFRSEIPEFDEIMAVRNIKAYVDRKLFIHNLGHAAAAYIGYRADSETVTIWEALELPGVRDSVHATMMESASALARAYPDDLDIEALSDHVTDLMQRFCNKSLGDTVYRVGRDLTRKLNRDDRVLGAARLCAENGVAFAHIVDVFIAGLAFKAGDEAGNILPADDSFLEQARDMSVPEILSDLCGLDPENSVDRAVLTKIVEASE